MTRTLPWLKEQQKSTASSGSRVRPAKRKRSLDSESDQEQEHEEEAGGDGPMGTLTPIRHVQAQSARANRTPSTSPPPAPPKEEFMHEGLDADDIYIMVEDEFLATAQSFTTHLHHAEYQRLKSLTRSKNAATIIDISRPTSLSLMSKELRIRKIQAARAAKQKVALEQIGASKQPVRSAKDDDADSDVDIVREDDPWAGTTLQGLMTSASRKTMSLVGLQGVASSTRAAAGYSKPKQRIDCTRIFDIGNSSARSSRRVNDETASGLVADESTASEDDDLEKLPLTRGPITFANDQAGAFEPTRRIMARKVSFQDPPDENPRGILQPRTKFKSSVTEHTLNRTTIVKGLDSHEHLTWPTPLLSRRAGSHTRAKDDQEKGKTNINEIPIFLV